MATLITFIFAIGTVYGSLAVMLTLAIRRHKKIHSELLD